MDLRKETENKERVLVLGASTYAHRYSNMVIRLLERHGHEIVAIGKQREASVGDVPIYNSWDADNQPVDTVTMYLNPAHQQQYEEQILKAKPKRLIFNPGSENIPLAEEAKEAGIEVLFACTLVMLNTGQF